MSDVKRYTADVATCVDVLPAESVYGAKVVLASDYAALEAELAKLRAGQEPVALTGAVHGCFVQPVPSHCDRITWRGQYYHLPITPQPSAVPDRTTIREVFMRNGFTIKEGQSDLKPYVYAAAEELLRLAAPSTATVQGVNQQLLEALEGLVDVNEQHNAAIQRVTGTPAGWKDDYLNQARAAIAAARKEGGKV